MVKRRVSKAIPMMALVLLVIIVPGGCRKASTETWLADPAVYRTWQVWPEKPIDSPIPGHRATVRRIFISPAALQVKVTDTGGQSRMDYPEDAVIIKEVYPSLEALAGGIPEQLTAMVKRSDHPDSREGWVWITKDPKNQKEKVITQRFCADCHADANGPHPYGDGNPSGAFRDSVFVPFQTER